MTRSKLKPQCKYSDEDRYIIAKYAKERGSSKAATFFKSKYTTINEFTVRGFVRKFDENIKVAKASGQPPEKRIKLLVRGRPLMTGPIIDEKVRKFMVSLYTKGGHVSRSIATTTAMVLLGRSDDESLKNVVVTNSWGRSLLQRIGFRRRAATTAKVEIPETAKKKEAGLQHHYLHH